MQSLNPSPKSQDTPLFFAMANLLIAVALAKAPTTLETALFKKTALSLKSNKNMHHGGCP